MIVSFGYLDYYNVFLLHIQLKLLAKKLKL